MNIEDRIYRYVENKFQSSGQSAFPTVRQVARALRLSQKMVHDTANSFEQLQTTSYFCIEHQPIGDHFVETFEKGGDAT